jgi:hypothetical protein
VPLPRDRGALPERPAPGRGGLADAPCTDSVERMSPVSRRRSPSRPTTRSSSLDALRVRHQAPLDVLGHELDRLRDVEDAFVVEATFAVLVDLLDVRGHRADPAFEAFCRTAVADPRATSSAAGLTSTAVLAELGHPAVRAEAEALVAAARPELTAAIPGWGAALGRVHVVEAGAVRTADGLETVLHVMLDYDVAGAGARHLLTIAAERSEKRVHLLDVRGRQDDDSLAPVAARYADPAGPTWTWVPPESLTSLVVDSGVAAAVRETALHSPGQWPVVDVETAPSLAWAFGVRRLETLTGLALTPVR